MKKLFLVLTALLLLIPIVFSASTTPDTKGAYSYIDEKTGETVLRLPKVNLTEGIIPPGENGTLILTYFTKAYVQFYEGSKLDFNLYGESMNDLLAANSLILTKVTKDGAEFLFSQDGSDYKPLVLSPKNNNNKLTLNFTGPIPFMFVELYKWRYLEDPEVKNHVTLFFNTPVVPAAKRTPTAPTDAYTVIDVNKVSTTDQENSNTWIYYLAGIIAIVIALVLLLKPYFQKEESH